MISVDLFVRSLERFLLKIFPHAQKWGKNFQKSVELCHGILSHDNFYVQALGLRLRIRKPNLRML